MPHFDIRRVGKMSLVTANQKNALIRDSVIGAFTPLDAKTRRVLHD